MWRFLSNLFKDIVIIELYKNKFETKGKVIIDVVAYIQYVKNWFINVLRRTDSPKWSGDICFLRVTLVFDYLRVNLSGILR